MANRSYIIWSILSRTPATGRQRIQCVVSRVSVFIHRRNDYVSVRYTYAELVAKDDQPAFRF